MRILFDGNLNPLPKSGIERYFTMLAKNLPTSTSLATSNRSHTGVLRIGPHCVDQPPLPAFRPRRLSGFLNALAWSAHRFDLVHLMNYGPSQFASHLLRNGTPLVLTVHDLIHEIRGAPPDLLDRTARQRNYDRANVILCVSDYTRKDLQEHYDVDRNKLHVVFHGSSLEVPSIIPKDLENCPPYFLHVGPRSGYKNFSPLLPVIKNVLGQKPDIQFRLVGPSIDQALLASLRDLGIEAAVVEERRVDDIRLAALYFKSIALLHPSLHEGFGIPLLEAMSCATVPIALKCTSIPEVLGESGILVQQEEFHEGFEHAMLKLIENPSYRNELVKCCLERANLFSWNRAAKETLTAYVKAMA